jgi:TrmH family RNA methyltransferase
VVIDPEQVRVVLVRTRNPLNIGACARAMSNFGFQKLRVVQPYELAFREAKSAVGGAAVLQSAEEFDCVSAAVADCSVVVGTTAARDRELHHELVPLSEASERLRQELGQGARVALLFGSEKRGLLNDDLSHCHWLMQIPTHDENPSMNLGQAVAVCLYELSRTDALTREALNDGEDRGPRINAGDEERITGLLLEALTESGYVKAGAASATEEKARRMVRRMNLSAEDAELWMGMLRKLLWKLGVRKK